MRRQPLDGRRAAGGRASGEDAWAALPLASDRPGQRFPTEMQQTSNAIPERAAASDASTRRASKPASHRTRRGVVLPPWTPEFVPWPGANALGTFESGELVRLDLPASVLPSLGLLPPASQVGVVRADVLIGQDGF